MSDDKKTKDGGLEESTPTSAAWEATWTARVTAFCTAVGIDEDAFTKALVDLVGERSEDALNALASDEFTPFDDIRAALKDAKVTVPVAKLRMHIAKLRAPVAAEDTATGATAPTTSAPVMAAALPTVPDDASFLDALRTGGKLQVDKIAVISAIRAALANQSGVFDLPKAILAKMEAHAEASDVPVGEDFFKVRKLVASRRYGDVLAAFDVNANFVSEGKKNAFLGKIERELMPQLRGFQDELHRWQQSWMATANNSGAAMMMIAAANGSAGLPPGMMQPPDIAPLISRAETVIDAINRVFAGFGLIISRALAHEAGQIMELLNNPQLPAMIGTTTRELMLRELGVRVLSDHVRIEKGTSQFALAIMELPTLSGNELAYIASLYQLGSTLFTSQEVAAPKPSRRGRQSYTGFDDAPYLGDK